MSLNTDMTLKDIKEGLDRWDCVALGFAVTAIFIVVGMGLATGRIVGALLNILPIIVANLVLLYISGVIGRRRRLEREEATRKALETFNNIYG